MKKKKLFHISLGTHNGEMWRSFDRHFDTRHFDWTPYQDNPHFINQQVRKVFHDFKPDIVFMQLQHAGVISIPTAQYLAENSITVNWTGDVRHPIPFWYAELGKHIDCTLFSNMNDVDTFNALGIPANYLQVGFDEHTFTPHGNKNPHYPDIVFLGSNYLDSFEFPLSRLRYQMVQTLNKRYGARFMAYGNNWAKLQGREQFLHPPQEAEAYRSSKISINLSHFDYGRYSSDRMLRMMGSGGFCLTHHFKDIEKDYDVGTHVATWNGIDSLIRQIDYFLDHPDEREQIRQAGCDFVRGNYTWNNVMEELKKILGV
jgi:spore maturation protein CgeB